MGECDMCNPWIEGPINTPVRLNCAKKTDRLNPPGDTCNQHRDPPASHLEEGRQYVVR